MTTITNTIEDWRLAARVMKIKDAEGFANGFLAAKRTSIEKPGTACVVLKSDGSRTTYVNGEKVGQ